MDTAILTNISQDHLDYHESMAAYGQAKQRLFTDFNLRHAVINGDDDYGQLWLQQGINAENISIYGQGQSAGKAVQHIHKALNIALLDAGMAFQWQHNQQLQPIKSRLLGRFNVDNLLAMLATLAGQGFDNMPLTKVVAHLTPVPGRMNMIRLTQKPVTVVIDFAHTPDALAQVLKALSAHCQHDLWCVFGCGGDRDRSKRPQMGQIAENLAQHVIVTDDNPRYESAAQIAQDIAQGMTRQPLIIHNRKAAIEQALQQTVAGDVLLIAGKGHETTQQIKDQYIEFNDFQVVQNWQEAAA
ncbi:MAG: UDP-N-acetylmuramoyl-L-alanyl-D-glutamate--2,6-diaminopimelate ligase [Proteobacteria bacterium]|nr:MAG: UDP-N-acetylmuramoyl-L-alanyl-D-glutamate--2,6-diaminopimelate ligase [Pseudomonadota bacterium]